MARGLVSSIVGVGASLWLLPSAAVGAPIELVEQRDQFMLFDDVDGSVEGAFWFSRPGFLAGYDQVEAGFLAVHPDDSQFIVIYTTWSLPAGIGAFFQSVSNDIHGIGFEHIAPEDAVIPEPYFDDTPNSQVTGFLNMNRWTQYLGSDPGGTDDLTISLIFGQELGHAWGSFVYYSQGGGWETNMLGRANAHWSFYLNSGGSPMQGHEWVDNGDGTFTALKQDLFRFSDLDLYLMGLLPAQDVAPWFLLENPYDCFDAASGDGVCAPPQAFLFEADTYTVGATRRDITIDDVIAVEGSRVPAWPEAPDTFDVSFLLIKRPEEMLSEDELNALDVIIGRSIELFGEQTRGLGTVVNRTAAEPTPGDDTGGSESTGGLDDTGTDGSTRDDPGPTSGSPAPDTGTGDGTGGTGDDAGQDQGEGGCGCRSPGSSPSPGPNPSGGLGLALLALGAIRRRRPQLAAPR
ncbi:MAG: hypothetical protein KDK70_12470 [Myxococcales bacterium]|nr:hypothetical protein [Myxococcales bacterium]